MKNFIEWVRKLILEFLKADPEISKKELNEKILSILFENWPSTNDEREELSLLVDEMVNNSAAKN